MNFLKKLALPHRLHHEMGTILACQSSGRDSLQTLSDVLSGEAIGKYMKTAILPLHLVQSNIDHV